jgi:hypothetical protein
LPESNRDSEKAFVYTVSRENLQKIYLKGIKINESMLGTEVAKFSVKESTPKLPRGNYLIVKVVGGSLSISAHTVDNIYIKPLNSRYLQLFIYDTSGNTIKDADVTCQSRQIKFDDESMTYKSDKFKKNNILEIGYKDVYHYVSVDINYYTNYNKELKKSKVKKSGTPTYNGFLVFSKPRYKPGDTVKFKAYLADKKYKPYNKEVNIRLYHHNGYMDTILTKLKPYRPGMYEYEFVLKESFKLKLDNGYYIQLLLQDSKDKALEQGFYYENYALKNTKFKLSFDKQTYYDSDPIKIRCEITDFNDLPAYGGKVILYINPRYFFREEFSKSFFIPDNLWRDTVYMDGFSVKETVVPGSLFPKGISGHYYINYKYISSDNNIQQNSAYFYRYAGTHKINFDFNRGMLNISQKYCDSVEKIDADYTIEDEIGETISSGKIALPGTLNIPWRAAKIKVKSATVTGEFFFNKIYNDEKIIGSNLIRENDTVYIKIDNPSVIPFWYTIKRGNKNIASGHTSTLYFKDFDPEKRGYSLLLNYFFAGENHTTLKQLPYKVKNITINVSAPEKITPGERRIIEVSATDKKGKPAANTDITAYAYTSMFGDSYRTFTSPFTEKKAGNIWYANFISTEKNLKDIGTDFNLYLWSSKMGLDTIEFFRFLTPEKSYVNREINPDGSTNLIPFIVRNGVLQGMQMVWIDGRLRYYKEADQLNPYLFKVEPGFHNIRIRTFNEEYFIDSLFTDAGIKTICSFNADNLPEGAVRTTRLAGLLNDNELKELSESMITIENSFGTFQINKTGDFYRIPAYIINNDEIYYLNHNTFGSFNQIIYNNIYPPILAGPFPAYLNNGMRQDSAKLFVNYKLISTFVIKGGNRYDFNKNRIIKWRNLPFGNVLNDYIPKANFNITSLSPDKISSDLRKRIEEAPKRIWGTIFSSIPEIQTGKNCVVDLVFKKDINGKTIEPAIIVVKLKEGYFKNSFNYYYGGTTSINNLPTGKVTFTFVLNDTLSISMDADIKSGGRNYIVIDSAKYDADITEARRAFAFYRILPVNEMPVEYSGNLSDNQTTAAPDGIKEFITGTVRNNHGRLLAGVMVRKSDSNTITHTDSEGNFRMPFSGEKKIMFYYSGHNYMEVTLGKKRHLEIVMEKNSSDYNEVVEEEESPFAVIQDVPVTNYTSVSLKDYQIPETEPEIRHSFNDEAFWRPALKTGKDGKVSFEVKFPDDITKWSAFFHAIRGKREMDFTKLTIKSFKPLSASLVTPEFAIKGDTLGFIGHLNNYLNDTIDVLRTIKTEDSVLKSQIRLGDHITETFRRVASEDDSIKVTYYLQKKDGYSDGEERKVPLFERGMICSYGEFKVLDKPGEYKFKVDPALGDANVYAFASGRDLLDNVIDKIAAYEYNCNEQMASKLIARLVRMENSGGDKEDREIVRNLISSIMKNIGAAGVWGWWRDSFGIDWITDHVISALIRAEKDGFKTGFDKMKSISFIQAHFKQYITFFEKFDTLVNPYYINELTGIVMSLHRMDTIADYKPYLRRVEKLAAGRNILKLMEAKMLLGLQNEVNVEDVLLLLRSNLSGQMNLGAPDNSGNTDLLSAYSILKMKGGYARELASIRSSLCEMSLRGYWLNTYLSAKIIESIYNDLPSENGVVHNCIFVNDNKVNYFPYSGKIDLSELADASGGMHYVTIRKEETEPVYMNIFQRLQIENPLRENAKGIQIESSISGSRDSVIVLKEGETVQMNVVLNLSEDVNFMMIEVPIPGGCTFYNKIPGMLLGETHREYYKDRVVIFLEKCKRGKRNFTIDLLPRFSGSYMLNPARAELMYYPVIYGNEGIKRVNITN